MSGNWMYEGTSMSVSLMVNDASMSGSWVVKE